MLLQFPDHFFWGTSTAATQVETAGEHNWKGVRARDGYLLDRTTDHEKRRDEDLEYISRLGNVYRCSVDWARLQDGPYKAFDEAVIDEYQIFFSKLNERGVEVMFVIHHFTNPLWFEQAGGWLVEENVSAFVDYARQCIAHFGSYVFSWNTFNEPNVYAMNAYMLGNFPPYHRSWAEANKVLLHMGIAHEVVYEMIKTNYPKIPVGISFNTAWFDAANTWGRLPAAFTDWWFHRKAAKPFSKKLDYWGLSYYAYVPFNPKPITELDYPGKLSKMGIPHDNMWGYRPEGLARIFRQFHKKYKKPIVITENGICTDDPHRRIQSIRDYLKICHQAIKDGVDLRGYIHWSTWDNFEWHLGPTYRFGLVHVNVFTKDRTMTAAGEFYEQIVQNNSVDA
jgi:beta-glucosidase